MHAHFPANPMSVTPPMPSSTPAAPDAHMEPPHPLRRRLRPHALVLSTTDHAPRSRRYEPRHSTAPSTSIVTIEIARS